MKPEDGHWIPVGIFCKKEEAETFSKYLSSLPQVSKIIKIKYFEGGTRYRVLRLIPKKVY